MGSCSLIQGIFPTQVSNPGLLHCKWILYQLSHRGSPHARKVMLKILQARLQQYVNHELPDFKLVLEKAEEPEIKLPTSTGSPKKQESSRITSTSALLTMPKPLTVWITVNCGKFWKRWECQTSWPAFWEICMQAGQEVSVRTGHGTTDWLQIRKGVCQGCIYCLPAYMQNTSCEMLGWMEHKLESRLLG